MAGNTAVFVVDESLANPSAAAFAGPVPPEASEESQNFYYYYEDDADDTNVSCFGFVLLSPFWLSPFVLACSALGAMG
jgi:hypothetical protein